MAEDSQGESARSQDSQVKKVDQMSHDSSNAEDGGVSSGYAESKQTSGGSPTQMLSSAAYVEPRRESSQDESDDNGGSKLHEGAKLYDTDDHQETDDSRESTEHSDVRPHVAGVTLHFSKDGDSESRVSSKKSVGSDEPATEQELRLWQASCGLASSSASPPTRPNISADVVIRPATREDMGQVTRLYNDEVATSYKLYDKAPVSITLFTEIFEDAMTNHLPFVVAVRGNGRPSDQEHIVGFALMDVAARGIIGSYFTRGAHRGKLTVLVDPEYRRKQICTALLDTIFRCCSANYKPRTGVEFANPNDDPRYLAPQFNVRQWDSVDISFVVRNLGNRDSTIEGDEFTWLGTYLMGNFDMTFVGYEEQALKDVGPHGPCWYDVATFRHQCRRAD
ncbi:hypothetical protein GGS26DRAFT_541400 [Hypomontagnella submonticulosa]|nr:hypothetical protein GGS26DRAFT_541400 [Hypomontagnella submonticulosa]